MTTWSRPQCRDLTLAYLGLLHAMATGSQPVDPVRLEVLLADGLDHVLDELRRGGTFTGIPNWLVDADGSGLQLILNAATEPADGGSPSVPAELARLLGGDMIDDLLDLSGELSGQGGSAAPPASIVVLAIGAGRYVATSLWPADDPIAHHPWFRHVPTGLVASVRRALSPFESLADRDIEVALDAGYVWPPQVPGRPALGLHQALVALAGTTELSTPPGLMAIGDSDDDGTFQALTEEEIAARAGAVAHLTCDVLVPTTRGWQLTRADGTVLTMADAERGLDPAAHLVWGEEWAAWKRAQHRAALVRLGWIPVEWTDVPPNQPIPETDVSQVGALYAMFHDGRKVAVLGGTQSSGKSVIVRRLSARLDRQRRPPVTRIIASTTHELPSPQVALRVGRHALAMDEATRGQRRLLILEDLHPVGDGDVDSLLPYLSENLEASVLTVLQYDVNSNEEWQTDHLNVVTAVVGRPAMREFVEQLCEAYPAELDRAAGLAELKRPHSTRDVRRLIQVMLGTRSAPDEDTAGPKQDSALANWFRSLDEASREALATTAAHSLARGGVARALIDLVAPGDVAVIGIQPNANGIQWSIPSPDDCRTVLVAYRDSRPIGETPEYSAGRSLHPIDATMADLLLLHLLELCRDGSAQMLTYLRGIRLHRNALCAEVVRRAWTDGALRQWIQQAHPANVAELLVSLNVWLSNAVVNHAITTLVNRLGTQTDTCRLQDVLIVLRCLRANLSEITQQWRSISEWIRDQVTTVLADTGGSPDERFELLRRAESFHDPMLQQLIADRAIEILPGLDASRADDYSLVRRVCVLQNRAERALGWEQKPIPIDQEEVVQGLLTGEPPENAGFHVVLAWLSLRRYFKRVDWDGLLDAHQDRFPQAMRYTSPHEFSRAIDELRAFRPAFANALLKRAFRPNVRRRVQGSRLLVDAIRKMLRDSTPIEAANLIRSVSNSHASAARELLYTQPDVPDDDLAGLMADRVDRLTDTKGAGMLLSAAHRVDDMYVVASAGFARQFGERLGEQRVLRLLREDPRPSVKYYLIKGLWETQAPFRHACLATTRDIIAEAMTTGRKPWGPRLALQVAADADMGQEFLVDLREQISLKSILDGMGHYSSPEAQTEFHRLGRALYPEAADHYVNSFHVDTFLEPLAAATPVSAIECCREVGRTLADADYHGGGRDILAAADRVMGEPDVWANRLARTRTGEHLAQALNILLDIDHQTARSVVATLGYRITRGDDEDGESLLVWKTRHAMLDSPTAAASLLKSLEDAEPGLGQLVYGHLLQNSTLFNVFSFELQLLQSPSAQYTVARQLASVGVLPGRIKTEWISQVFQVKLPFVAVLGNPQVLADVIRMLAIWNEAWADRAVRGIDHTKVYTRLRLGLSRDLSPAIGLAGLLHGLNDHAGSVAILDALSEYEPAAIVRYAGLRKACMLLDLVRFLRPQQTGRLAAEIDAAIGSSLRRAVVLDDCEQWAEIGYACHALDDAGLPATVTDAPHTTPNMAHYAAVVWGLHLLPTTSWRQRPLEVATERLYGRPPTDSMSLFCTLAAAAKLGRLNTVSQFVGNSALARLSFRQLRVLYELAERQTDLAILLGGCEDEIRQRLAEPTARVYWDARRLTESLTRLDEQRGLRSTAEPNGNA